MIEFRAGGELALVDRLGERDAEWRRCLGFARQVFASLGAHCLACGRRLWHGRGRGRLYCDDACRSRHNRRRERFRSDLRDLGESCPFCNCNGHGMVTES